MDYNNTGRPSTASEKQNFVCGIKYLEEPLFKSGVIERAKVISDNFALPIGNTVESYSVSEMVPKYHHYKNNFHH
jgi:hypothetical protein